MDEEDKSTERAFGALGAAQLLVTATARRMANGAQDGPGGTGWGTGVVVKIQPTPEADVTVEAIKTNCKCWAGSSMVAKKTER